MPVIDIIIATTNAAAATTNAIATSIDAVGNCGLYTVTIGLVNLDIEVSMNVNDFCNKIHDYIMDNENKCIPSTLSIRGYLNKKTYLPLLYWDPVFDSLVFHLINGKLRHTLFPKYGF